MTEQIGTARVLARRIDHEKLPTVWRKTVIVPPGSVGVAVRASDIRQLPPGKHVVGGVLGPRYDEVGIVFGGTLVLCPLVDDLLSGDDQLVEGDLLVRLRVDDPQRLYGALGDDRDLFSDRDLRIQIAEGVRPELQSVLRDYDLLTVRREAGVQDRISAALASRIAALVEPLGVRVERVSHFSLRERQDQVERQKQLNALQSHLRTLELEALQDRAAFRDYFEGSGFEDVFSPAEMETLRSAFRVQVEGSGGALDDETLRKLLDQALRQQEARLGDRFQQILQDENAPQKKGVIHAVENVLDVATSIGQIVGGLICVVIYFVAQITEFEIIQQAFFALVSIIFLLLMTLLRRWVLNRWGKKVRAAEPKPVDPAAPNNRRLIDAAVHRRFVRNVQQILDNVKLARRRVYEAGQADLALQLGEVQKQIDRLNREAQSTSPGMERYFQAQEIAGIQAAAVLDYYTALQARVARVVSDSHELVQAVQRPAAGRSPSTSISWATIQERAGTLERQLLHLSQDFGRRQDILERPADV